ncbi:MAG: cytochrome c3 family protein [Actinomycetota bacterium]|nr:cytochrome c3 family protein [Actinomycetota bacterium]
MTEKKLHIHFLFNKKVGFLIALSILILFLLFNSIAFAINPPTGLNVTAEAPPSCNINLAWNPPSLLPGEAVDHYRVYRALSTITDANKGAADLIAPKVLATIYTDSTGIPGETYYYQVTVVDTLGNESPVSINVINDHATVSGSENPHDSYSDFSNLCRDCHRIHLAPGSTLVFRRESEKEVCFVCHDETGSPYNIKQLFLHPSRHSIEPETEPDGVTIKYCHDCHSPHSNKDLRPKLIKDTIRGQSVTGNNNTVCYACHENISYLLLPNDAWYGKTIYNKTEHYLGGTAALTTYPGTTYATGLCLNCHDPHGSPYNDIRRNDRNDLCKACHDDPSITLPATYSYRGMAWYLLTPHYSSIYAVWPNPGDTGAWLTGGATSGECINCHNPHGRSDSITGPNDDLYPKLLLKWEWNNNSQEEFLCYGKDPAQKACHAATTGSVSGINIYDGFTKGTATYNGPPGSPKINTRHDIGLDAQNYSGAKVECIHCHNPHINTGYYDYDSSTAPPTLIRSKFIDPDNRAQLFSGTMTVDYTTGTVTLPGYREFCNKCHDNVYPSGVTAPTVTLINVKEAYIKDYHGDKAGTGDGMMDGGMGAIKPPYQRGMAALPCTDCHDPHGSKNIYHIRESITTDQTYSITVTTGVGEPWNLCQACHTKGHKWHHNCFSCHYHGSGRF